ncbi:MAG: GNAT family N-acetyltransferase [Rhodospirillales bacterium]|nr:GNAT family N-acetyltransferase [Rhodospirillales bacterium]
MNTKNAIDVRPFREEDGEAYSAFLDGHDARLIYYSLNYKALLEDTLGCRSEYWLAIKGERVVGILPVMAREGPFGRVLNSLPFFGSHGGVLASDDTASWVLLAKFEELASGPDVATATMVENVFQPLDHPPDHDFQDDRIGQVSSLGPFGGPENEAFGRLTSIIRNRIRKARSEGVSVAIDNDAMGCLESLHRENMAAIGGTPKPAAFFAGLGRHFRPGRDYNIFVAERGAEKIAALLVFYFGRTVEYVIPATRTKARTYQPMELIVWTALRDAAEGGFSHWNWGGTWRSQTGVHRFKRKWGATEHVYRYFVKVNNQDVMRAAPDELLAGYPYFYTIPFDRLHGVGSDVESLVDNQTSG